MNNQVVIDKIYELINKSNIINENVNILKIKNSKNIIIVGDSYTEGYNPDGNVPSWTGRFKYIINPEKLYVNYKGGTGFGFKVDDVDFLKLIQTVQGVTDKNKITDIIFVGGFNDQYATSTSNIYKGIKDCINYCKSTYVNAKIHIGCIGWSNISEKCNKIKNTVLPIYKDCLQYGAFYLSNVEYLMHDINLFASDGVHPSELGQCILGDGIAQAFQNGLSVYKGFRDRVISPVSDIAFDDRSFGMSLYNSQTNVISTGLDIKFNNPITIKADQSIKTKIANIINGYTVGNYSGFDIVPISGYLYLPSYKYRNFNGTLILKNKEVLLNIVDINDEKDNFSNLTINRIYINPFNIMLNN